MQILVCAVVAMAFCSCSKSDNGSSSTPGAFKIAVIPKGESHAYWKSVKAGVDKAAAETGCVPIWKGPPREDDRSSQIGLVEQYVSDGGVNGICLAPLDASALVDPVGEANKKNIPVLIFDSALKGEAGKDFISFVATDNHAGGAIAGEELARVLGGKGKVVMLRYAVGSASTEQREAGFLEAIAKHPDITMIEKDRFGGATLDEAQKNAENLLDKLKDCDGIFCPNESSTQAMMNVLKDNGLAGKKKFVGFDTSVALLGGLKDGTIEGLVAQNPTYMGYMAVKTMVAHLKGEKVPVSIDTG
ncbi:MAG TPA: substrate-binding domain-containing protein, partial [Tepidisphaeraceae bacterium]|nr:substrate-binding domain-containing protein [Tepidisphaeraceae bacterium]